MHHARCLGWTYGDTNEGGELHEGSASSVVSPLRKFPRLSHNTIPNAGAATVARQPSTRVICHLALAGKTEMSISNSPSGFKREMRVLEIVRGFVRAVFAVMRRQDGGSPCGGRGATALPPFVVGPVRCTSIIRICVAAVSHVTPRRADGESCARWVTSRPPAAGTSQEGRGGCFCKRWIICAVRRIRQDEG